jgi:valyl-tRNA synthetase
MLEKSYRPKEVEEKIYSQWDASGAFACGREPDGQPYTIVIPPPNVTGSLHLGHALNNTLQDILVRSQRMRGRDVLWQPGMDHAGIATQMVVERQLAEEGIVLDRGRPPPDANSELIGREAFVERVWQWKEQSGGTIINQLRRLGASCDWSRERFTMDEGLSAAVRKVFVELYRKDLIYKDKRLINWDPKLHTAISDLEVEQREFKGQLWYFRYPINGMEGQSITVATTRPETMLGDTGVAVHPDDARYRDLIGKHCRLPIAGRLIPIVADEHADPEKGSGAVKITPGHDFNDFEVGRRHRLDMINVFDEDARLNENAPAAYRGIDRFAARDMLVAEMERLGLLEKIEDNDMTMPYGDRSGVVIEPWLMDQWYVDAKTLAGPAIEAVESGKMVFVPKNWENTYFEWMRNIEPWCISRQLWWGHRIPAWYGPDGKIFVAETAEEAETDAAAHYGKPVVLDQETDVLDTWFSSALWPFSTLGWPEQTPELARYYPTDVLVTSFDIIFFWVARMMMMGLHFMGEAPFHTVYIHALVRDEKGQKMSKSKGNIIDPLELVEKFGTDSLRFTLAALAAQGRDVRLAESRVEGYRNFATKLWNAARYCEINGCAPVREFDPSDCNLTVNKWIASAADKAAADVTAALDGFKFNEAAGSIYRFAWGTFCDWYLEFTKPILSGGDDDAAAETRATTAWVLDQILRLLHPFMPFITEELWSEMASGRESLLIEETWPNTSRALAAPEAEAELDWVVRLISEIRAVRAEMNVPAGARLNLIIRDLATDKEPWLVANDAQIKGLARVQNVTKDSGTSVIPEGSIQIVIDEATVILPLAGIIDLDQERGRLEKEITKAAGEIGKLEKKLANKGFIEKAPEEVIAENRQRLADAQAQKTKLGEALTRIAGF